jgi:NtrC-family two-component system response regulator AlgB
MGPHRSPHRSSADVFVLCGTALDELTGWLKGIHLPRQPKEASMSHTTLPAKGDDGWDPPGRSSGAERAAADDVRNIYLSSTNPAMSAVIRTAHQTAMGPRIVLLNGESGVGKRTLAGQIHQWSPWRNHPFLTIDCAAPYFETLETARLDQIMCSAAEQAAGNGATVLFDNITELCASGQRRVLEFIEANAPSRAEYNFAIGSIRIMACSTGSCSGEAAANRFSKDLFHLISEVALEIPPLRERPEDILPLAEHMLVCAAQRNGTLPMGFAADAIAALAHYDWPGNLRELRQVIERAAILAESAPTVTLRHLPRGIGATRFAPARHALTSLEEMERRYIARVLAETQSLEKAAETLGIHPTTLWRKRRRYHLIAPLAK